MERRGQFPDRIQRPVFVKADTLRGQCDRLHIEPGTVFRQKIVGHAVLRQVLHGNRAMVAVFRLFPFPVGFEHFIDGAPYGAPQVRHSFREGGGNRPREIIKLVDDGVVSGWDDPRMPTLSGVRRRGYTPAAIRDFCERIGVAKAVSEVDVRLLEHCVREDLNAHAPRVMGVLRPLKLTIENYPEGKTELLAAEDLPGGESTHEVPFSKHLFIEQDDFLEVKPNNKYFRLYVGGEVRLKNAYIIKCERVVKDADGSIAEVVCTYDETTKSGGENSGRKVKGTLHWVERDTAVKAQVRLLDYLFTESADGTCVANPDSLTVLDGAVIEPHIRTAEKGSRFQFMRQGYFCIDTKDTADGKLVFNQIVSLKDSFAKTMKK